MKHTDYYKSGRHKLNALKAQEYARQESQRKKQERIDIYLLSPIKCLNCNSILPYSSRKNKFCSKSCSGTYNGLRKPLRSLESKLKTSNAVKETIKFKKENFNTESGSKSKLPNHKFCKIQWHRCQTCNKLFYTRTWSNPRKSCGATECKTHLSVGNRPYRNGRRKIFLYYNKHQNKEVLLESSWELDLAKWLDEKNIVWMRPSYIRWFDSISNKQRLYYPDFYLPEMNLYLDPKNPTALKLEKHKMQSIEQIIPIKYGSLDSIKDYILMLL